MQRRPATTFAAMTLSCALVSGCAPEPRPATPSPTPSVATKSAPSASVESAPAPSTSTAPSSAPPVAAEDDPSDDDTTTAGLGGGTVGGLGALPSCINGWTTTFAPGPGGGSSAVANPPPVRELRGDVTSAIGALPREGVRQAICAAFDGPRSCFVAARPTLGDKPTSASVAFEIDSKGSVTSAKLSKSDADAKLAACLVDAIRATKFESSKGKTSAAYVFDVPKKPPPLAKVMEVKPTISKGLAPDIVRRVVRQRFSVLRACYEQALAKDPKLAGAVSVTFAIDKTGALKELKVTAATLSSPDVLACTTKIFASMKFPEPEGGARVDVSYPLKFANVE